MNRTLSAGAVTAMILAAVFPAGAQSRQRSYDGGNHRIVSELQLTDEQQTKLELLRLDHRKSLVEPRQEIRKIREKIREELLKESPEKAILDRYADQTGKIHAAMTMERHAHLLAIKKILTPGQFQTLVSREWRGEKGARGGEGSAKGKGKK